MKEQLNNDQRQQWRQFRELSDRTVAPRARDIDAAQNLPADLRRELARSGVVGSMLPTEVGGADLDLPGYGMLNEELGRTCSNVRNFIAVQDMVCDAIHRWGDDDQRKRWLPEITAGNIVAAFLLTEPEVGSDAQNVQTVARDDGADIVLDGTKKWISFGQCADVFLVFVQYNGRHTAVLVERNRPGVQVRPIADMLGLRGSMLAEITFDGCRVSADAVVGYPGAGLVFVASGSLELGRYSTAWGCVGLAQACLDEALAYTASRRQYGSPLAAHQLVQRVLADLLTDSRAARLLCWQAGLAGATEANDAPHQTLMAKYFSSKVAACCSRDAVQLLGAHGMSADSATGRFFRDAKAMEIIEGTTQVVQQLLGRWSPNAGHPAG